MDNNEIKLMDQRSEDNKKIERTYRKPTGALFVVLILCIVAVSAVLIIMIADGFKTISKNMELQNARIAKLETMIVEQDASIKKLERIVLE